MKATMIGVAVAALMAASPAMAEDLGAGVTINANGSASTESTFRGISQSASDLSVSAGAELGFQGAYVGVQGTTLGNDNLADFRIDYNGGYRFTAPYGVNVDAGVTYSTFRGDRAFATQTTDFVDYRLRASKNLGVATVGAGVTYSPNYLKALGVTDAVYTEADVTVPVATVEGVALSANGHVGHQFLTGSSRVVGSYSDWSVGARADYKNLFVGVSYVDSDFRTGGYLNSALLTNAIAGSKAVATVGVRF
jgi:uncharacterized protein (TIGR02001 family)